MRIYIAVKFNTYIPYFIAKQLFIYDDKKLRYTIFERNMFKEFVENIFNEISRMVKNHFIKILFKGDIFIGGKRKIIMLK